ncbi:MAG TPA: FAD:protein FMN transferase [Candidatus Binatia bacterium]
MSVARVATAALWLLLVPGASALASAREPVVVSDCVRDGRYVMGTILQVELCTTDDRGPLDAADVWAIAERLDALLTTWRADAPTSRFNAHAGSGLQPLPPEVIEVLALSREYSVLTRGTFDVTVGPLVTLWRDAGRRGELPAADALAAARARVGSEHIVLAQGGSAAALDAPGTSVDFGGIGKGYALDRIAGALRARGGTSALLDFGRSSIQAIGAPPDADGWRLLLAHPAGASLGVVTLRDRALSVSGSFGQTSEIAGRRFGHVLDPRTGWPMERDLVAAVVAPTGAAAEALSKALLLLGERDGIALLEGLDGIEGLLATADGHTWTTRGWDATVAFEAMPTLEAAQALEASRAPAS